MAEATQAQAPVVQGNSEADLVKRLTSVVNIDDVAELDPATAPEQTEPAEPVPTEAKTDEPTPDDIPAEEVPVQPQTAEEFEIVHNGATQKLPREEVIRLAQQGYDYTQKTQALAESRKAIDASLAKAAEIEQLTPLIANEQAQLFAIRSQIDQYQNVDWVAYARQATPQEYQAQRAQYDALVQSFNQAAGRVQQAVQNVQAKRQEISQQSLRQEFQKLTEYIPEWRDASKYEAESKAVAKYMVSQGAPQDMVDSIPYAWAIQMARKSMKYDQLVKSKADKSKLLQTAPPVARPGQTQTPSTAQSEKAEAAQKRLSRTGSLEDAAALYMTRLK